MLFLRAMAASGGCTVPFRAGVLRRIAVGGQLRGI
jgi:hypothetical protein